MVGSFLMEAKRFRRKPVEIEAIRWDGSEEVQREIVNWADGAVSGWIDDRYFLEVRTPKGRMRADEGDWIIRDIACGIFYACEAKIFDATYEAVEVPARTR